MVKTFTVRKKTYKVESNKTGSCKDCAFYEDSSLCNHIDTPNCMCNPFIKDIPFYKYTEIK